MKRRLLCFAVLLTAGGSRGFAGDETNAEAQPTEARLLTRHGEILHGVIAIEEIRVRTEYGELLRRLASGG